MPVRSSLTRKRSFAVGPSQIISREQRPGLDATLVKRGRVRELHLTLRPLPGETLSALLGRLKKVLDKHQTTIVKQDIFGALTAYKGTVRAVKQTFGQLAWPLTWLDGADCQGSRIAGMQLLAIKGAELEPLVLDDHQVGNVYHDGAARHCFLGDLTAANVTQSPAQQAKRAYANLETALKLAGMNMTHLVRTWLFLKDILAWYDKFNKVRSDFYRQKKVIGTLVPASTGVGALNPWDASMVIGAWAVQPLSDSVTVSEVASPLQCPAPNYGSCFSRAVELSTPDYRHLLVSGTASIEPGGRSVHDGDIAAQVDLTMRVVRGILEERGLSFLDVSRATAYFKYPKDQPAFADWCAHNGAAFLPVISTRADVCRDELLFEIEMDALAAQLPAAAGQPKQRRDRKGTSRSA